MPQLARTPAPSQPARVRTRGRPTADRAAAIDAAIQAAARELFLAVGFEATSMDAIAAAAGVSKGTLYARYERKELLFRAVLEAELERWSRRAGARDHLLSERLGPRLRQHARTLVWVLGWPEFKRIVRLLEASAVQFPDLASVWEEVGTRRYLRVLGEDIARVARPGTDTALLAQLFLHTISGWYRTENASRTVGKDEIMAFADRVIESIVALAEA